MKLTCIIFKIIFKILTKLKAHKIYLWVHNFNIINKTLFVKNIDHKIL